MKPQEVVSSRFSTAFWYKFLKTPRLLTQNIFFLVEQKNKIYSKVDTSFDGKDNSQIYSFIYVHTTPGTGCLIKHMGNAFL